MIVFDSLRLSFGRFVLTCPLQEANGSVKVRKTVWVKRCRVNLLVFKIVANLSVTVKPLRLEGG